MLTWLGMWLGITSGKALPSALRCVGKVMGLPTVLSGGALILMRTIPELGGRPLLMVFLWMGLGLAIPLHFGVKARRELLHDFRRLAAGL